MRNSRNLPPARVLCAALTLLLAVSGPLAAAKPDAAKELSSQGVAVVPISDVIAASRHVDKLIAAGLREAQGQAECAHQR